MANWGIAGNAAAVRLLERQIQAGRTRQAYLFTGAPRVGKMALALAFARVLNCTNDDRPCGQCRSCQQIARGNHPDVQIVGLAADDKSSEGRLRKNIGIGQVQELQHTLALQPYEARLRIAIVESAELLTQEAANALLKTLEEPPDRAVIMLLADDAASLLPTIRSRCQTIDLRPVAAPEIAAFLRERHSANSDDAGLLSRVSNGRPGWAIAALTDSSMLETRQARINDILAAIDEDLPARLNRAMRLAQRFSASREEVYDTLDTWQAVLRDALVIAADADDVALNIDIEAALQGVARRADPRSIRDALAALRRCRRQLGQNVAPRLAIEAAIAALPRAA